MSFLGALISRSGSQTVTPNVNTTLSFDVEQYDQGGWHDGVNPERLTVPSGVSLVRLTANIDTNGVGAGEVFATIQKNGANFIGMGLVDDGTVDTTGVNVASAIVGVAPGDSFTIQVNTNRSEVFGNGFTWFAIEAVDPGTSYALVRKNANQTIAALTNTPLTWQLNEVDTGGWHSTSSNTDRLTVPAGVSLVRLRANIQRASQTDGVQLILGQGASLATGGPAGYPVRECDTGGADHLNIVSALLEVDPGDYFRVITRMIDAGSVAAGSFTWAQIEAVPEVKRALVYRTGSTVSLSAATPAIIPMNAETYDLGGWHDNSTNSSRLTVPQGVRKVRVLFSAARSSATGQFIAEVRKNGTVFTGAPMGETDTSGGDYISGCGAVVECQPGDYFELEVWSQSAGDILYTNQETWFAVEEVLEPTDHDAAANFVSSSSLTASANRMKNGTSGFTVEGGLSAIGLLARPASIAFDASGNLTCAAALGNPWSCQRGSQVTWSRS